MEAPDFRGQRVVRPYAAPEQEKRKVNEMLGERELLRLIEANDFPARLITTGVTWVEIEVADPKTRAVRRERMSKSMFADLILDWRSRRNPTHARLRHALSEIDIAA